MFAELFLVLFILFILIACIWSGGISPVAASTESLSSRDVGVPGILVPANHPPKGLSVGFAETRDERIFSKKTGKVKYDRVGYT